MLNAGTILDERYEIVETIGVGGMSTVYRAKDERLKRFVALKVLKPEYSNDAGFVSKFRVEAQASAGLTHPNIVSVYDVCEDNGRYFIVMELVEGITLKEYIHLNGRLSMEQALDFSIQIASGVEAAHEHHVIHRDIKPQNIIVAKTGNLKVTDFGIAKAATSNTMSTAGMGSVHYISPEQARGGYSDERSDIYSLGITMYEMVTGRVPFEGDTNVAIALMHIQNEIIPPREYFPDIYSSFEKVILKATQKKPERRYLTAAALIADLRRVKNNPNIDIIVAPATVSNAPTQQLDMQKIHEESRNVQRSQGERMTSEVRPDRQKLNQLLDEADDEYDYGYEDDYEYEEPVRSAPRGKAARPQTRQQSIKRVADEEDDYYYDDEYESRRSQDDEVDPKLAKAVMIGGIAAAVIVAAVSLIIVGNVMGWFKFGGSKEDTTASVAVIASDSAGVVTEKPSEERVLEMIEVEGYSQMAAEKRLKDQGFMNIRVETTYDDKFPVEYVCACNYKPGEKLPESTQIVITVSMGAEQTVVPDVSGYTDEQATKVIQEAGFTVQHAFEYSDTIEKDKVIKTQPEVNEKAAKGSKVIIVVSNGAEIKKVAVPKVTGISESAASSSLEAVKLSVGSVSREHSDVEAGVVIRQSIAENTTVDEGTKIDLVVSDGPQVVTYTGTVAGSITASDPEFLENELGVTVTVYITDGTGSYEAATQAVAAADKASISISGKVTGLSASDGTVTISVKDDLDEDVTAYYRNSLTITFSPE